MYLYIYDLVVCMNIARYTPRQKHYTVMFPISGAMLSKCMFRVTKTEVAAKNS